MERAVAGAGMILAGGGCLLTLYTALAISSRLGVLLTVYAACVLVWFALSRFLLGRGVGRRVYPWLNPLVEGTAPMGSSSSTPRSATRPRSARGSPTPTSSRCSISGAST